MKVTNMKVWATLISIGCSICSVLSVSAQTTKNNATQIVAESSLRMRLTARGARYVRLHLPATQLPTGAALCISDVSGRSSQCLDALLMRMWQNSTAYFNGDTVTVEMKGAASALAASSLDIRALLAKTRIETERDAKRPGGGIVEVVIGTDDRTFSDNPASARIENVGCTGWLISAGLGLSAGHCFEPGTSPQILEFDVPPSLPDGTIQHPPANDQYPVDMTSVQSQADELNSRPGNDWAVFRILPNSAGSVFTAQNAFFRLTTAVPAVSGSGFPIVSVTGYGYDNHPPGITGGANAASQTEQQGLGQLLKTVVTDASHATLVYDADTDVGNSGSPVSLPPTMIAIGIHDGGGSNAQLPVCGSNQQCNLATAFQNQALIAAIQSLSSPSGIATWFVDAGSPSWIVPPDGTILKPYRSIEDAISGTTGNIALDVVSGYYAGNGINISVLGRSITLRAVAGQVTLGPVPKPVPLTP